MRPSKIRVVRGNDQILLIANGMAAFLKTYGRAELERVLQAHLDFKLTETWRVYARTSDGSAIAISEYHPQGNQEG